MTDVDVLIVGGGMVGASLACALGGLSLRVAIVESVPFAVAGQPSYDDRSIALAYGTKRVFEAMGLWSGLEAVATPIAEIHITDRGHFGAARLSAADNGFDALGYVVENRSMGRLFSDALPRWSNIEMICPGRILAIETRSEAVSVRIEHDGGERTLTSRLLVGADGGRSAVRTLSGISAQSVDYGQCAIIANITPENAHRNRAYERFTEHGPLALLPMSDNRCALVWTVPAERCDRMLALPEDEFLAALQACFGYRLGTLLRVGERNSYPLTLIRAGQYVAGRLALIGNAGHTLHPVAGQGFNLGLRDVAALAEVISDAAIAGRDVGSWDVLMHYDQWRRRDQQRVFMLTDGLVRIFSNDFTPLVMARNTGMVVLDLCPPLKRALMRQTMGLTGRLPRLARGLPLRQAG